MALKRAGSVLCFNAGLLSATRHLALRGSGGSEQSGNNYSRRALAASETALAANSAIASNSAAVNFATPSGAWVDPTSVALMSASSGGDVLFDMAMANNPDAPGADSVVGWASGELSFAIGAAVAGEASAGGSAGTLTLHGRRLCMKGGLLNGNRYFQLFSGNTGATALSVTRPVVALSEWTIANGIATLNTEKEFENFTVGNDATFLGLFDALTGGNMLWLRQLSNNPIPFPSGGVVAVGRSSSLPVRIQITTDD